MPVTGFQSVRPCDLLQKLAECSKKVDIGFLFDGTKDVDMSYKGNFQQSLSLATTLSQLFDISNASARIAVAVYSNYTDSSFSFDSHLTHASLRNAIEKIVYPNGDPRNIGAALNNSMRQLYNEPRPRVPRVLIVTAHDRSSDGVYVASDMMRRNGVIIYGISTGGGSDKKHLETIASDPDNAHVFKKT
ncbi:predicted protein, partial [Nematostella vectensis]